MDRGKLHASHLHVLVLILLFACQPVWSFNEDVTNLLTAKITLGSSNVILSSWDPTKSICSWRGTFWAYRNGPALNCSDPLVASNSSVPFDPNVVVRSVHLGAAGLTGSLPKEFGFLSSLTDLTLRENAITGPIPLEIGNSPSLNTILLDRNNINGTIPASLWNLCSQLIVLELDSNALEGPLPSPANPGTECSLLRELRLENNKLTGVIPAFLGGFRSLYTIDLSNNFFSGEIPVDLTRLTNLTSFNVASNNLSGQIPPFSTSYGPNAFLNNPSLCGSPLPTNCSLDPSTAAPAASPANASTSPANGGRPGRGGSRGLSPKVVAGIIIGVLAFFVVSGSLLIFLTQARSKIPKEKHDRGVEFRREFDEEDAAAGEAGKIVHFEGGESLTAEDVLNATGEVLGKTSYGTVYKAKLGNGFIIALRLLREGTARDRVEFVPAIQELGLIRHRNLVPLRAYYSGSKEEKLLVYDYMPRGSLADLLHSMSGKPAPGWARRHKIVLGAARGLAHLHTGLATPIIHGNLKSKNILVDDNYVPHLSDYGLERLMIPAATNDVVSAASAQGYKAPELIKLKRANTKTDIYSFGIVLLEVLTGKRPGKSSDSDEVNDLPTLVKAAVLEERTSELFDFEIIKGLLRTPAEDGLVQALQLAMGCCAPTAAVRPDIGEVIRQLEDIRPKIMSSIQSPLYTPDSTSTRSREAFDYL